MTFLDELKTRGLLQDHTPGLEDFIKKHPIKAYIGYDPTARSLTIGNLTTIMMLVHLQRHGHTPVVLFGGATGRVGDPSGKDAERKLLSVETIEENLRNQQAQFQRFLQFDGVDNAAQVVNNYDWFKDIGFITFLRDAGKHITINYMMGKESVKRRLEGGLSFTEFSYQLLQGYDFYHLHEHHGVNLQMGGSDQWGNITTGTEFVRRKSGGEVHAATCPLLTKADGTKYGKSEGQNIWLDPSLTSPYKFYQFLLNTADSEVEKLLYIFSLRDVTEIKSILDEHAENPGLRLAQKTLAEDLTTLVHGEVELEKAQEASSILFGKGTTKTLRNLDEQTFIDVFESVPQFAIAHSALEEGIPLIEFISSATGIYSSKGEARRALKGNAVAINKEKQQDENAVIGTAELINNRFILVQKGKKKFNLVVVS